MFAFPNQLEIYWEGNNAKSIGLACSRKKIYVKDLWQIQKFMCYCTNFALFYFEFEGNLQVQAPGGLCLERRFITGFFVLRVWGAYIWRGLFSEFYGISKNKQGHDDTKPSKTHSVHLENIHYTR